MKQARKSTSVMATIMPGRLRSSAMSCGRRARGRIFPYAPAHYVYINISKEMKLGRTSG